MARYEMLDGTVVDTDLATQKWVRPHRAGTISWPQLLYRSSKGRYYITNHAVLGQDSFAEYVTDDRATAWLIVNGFDLPEDLSLLREKVVE